MKSAKEKAILNINIGLVEAGFEKSDSDKIEQVILMALKDYDIIEECRELVVVDTKSEQMIKLFRGTLLTEGKSRRTVSLYTRTVCRMMEYLGKELSDISSMDIRLWLAYMQTQCSLVTCENYRSCLSAFFGWLATEELIEKNPMLKIKPIKFLKTEKTAFSSTDIDTIRGNCENSRNRAIVELLLSSGVRVEELTNLNRSDIDFNTLEVHVKCGKGGKSRTTYMSDICALHLQNYLSTRDDDLEPVFVSQKKNRISCGTVRLICVNLEGASGIENIHPHRFRRTFATNLWTRGMDLRTIQILLGHSNINTTMMYIANDSERVKAEYKRHA